MNDKTEATKAGGTLEVERAEDGTLRTMLDGSEVEDQAVMEVLLADGRWVRGNYDHGTEECGEWHPALLIAMAGGFTGYLQLQTSARWRRPALIG